MIERPVTEHNDPQYRRQFKDFLWPDPEGAKDFNDDHRQAAVLMVSYRQT